MIAEKNLYMSEAAAKMYELNADEIVRQQCQAREEYERHERWMNRRYKEAEQKIADQEKRIAELEALLEQQNVNR